MKDRVRAHEQRLRATFQRLLLLTMAPSALLQACSDDTVVDALGADAGDATTTNDAPSPTFDAVDVEQPDARGSGRDGSSDANAPDAAEADAPSDAPADIEDAGAAEDAEDATPYPWCADASAGSPWWPDASGNCKYFVDLSCAQYVPIGLCALGGNDCLKVCTLNTPLFACEYASPACTIAGHFVAEAGQPVTVECDLCPGAGRRPEGLRLPAHHRVRSAVAAYFARASYLEAASVYAFERLEQELRVHGAPEYLVEAARRSAKDEVRHARAMRRLASRRGAVVAAPRRRAWRERSLERVARENAIEGCLRETYGALVATWQAAHASDADVRRSFARIAVDETRHAALAWAISEWAELRLDAAAKKRLATARTRAMRRLAAEVNRDPTSEVASVAGVPLARDARRLFAGLTRQLQPDT